MTIKPNTIGLTAGAATANARKPCARTAEVVFTLVSKRTLKAAPGVNATRASTRPPASKDDDGVGGGGDVVTVTNRATATMVTPNAARLRSCP